MKYINIPGTDLKSSIVGYGCMNIGGSWSSDHVTFEERSIAYNAINAAIDEGINLFDHADIYVRGKSEAIFGDLLKQDPGLRKRIILLNKCGIRFAGHPDSKSPARYDFSYDHIVESVEGSLRRLNTDHLDILLLHRPDPLAEPAEVARAFDHLHASGKVRYFGVSNHNVGQIELLKRYLDQPITINQVEVSLLHRALIEEGTVFNIDRMGVAGVNGLLDYCRLNNILVQAWSPLAGGKLFVHGRGAPDALIHLIHELAQKYRTSVEVIVLGWITRHPAGIQPIVGTTNPDRLRASAMVSNVDLSRDDWYRLFLTARAEALP